MVSQQRLLEVFMELADSLVAEFDVIDFMHTLSEVSVELLEANAAGLMLADQRGHLHVIASSSEDTRLLGLFELQHDEGPCIDCYRQARPVVNITPDEAEDRWPRFGAAVRSAGFTSVHALPLRLRDQVIGAMNLYVARPGTLSQADLTLGQGLADMATIGLMQERAVREQTLLSEQLQCALISRIHIEQAKGILAERNGTPPEQAFAAIRARARSARMSLAAVAVGVIDGAQILFPSEGRGA